jgi:hypothetical protein
MLRRAVRLGHLAIHLHITHLTRQRRMERAYLCTCLVSTVELGRAWTYHSDRRRFFNAQELAKNPISLIQDGLNLLCRGTSSERAGVLPATLTRFSPSQFAFG